MLAPAKGNTVSHRKSPTWTSPAPPHSVSPACPCRAPSWRFRNGRGPPSRADPRVLALDGAWIFPHCAKPKVSKNRLPEIEWWLTGTCSHGCAKHTLWMTGVPPWCSRCAKHSVKNTWLLWLRKTRYLATSTGRGVPIAKHNIEQEVNYV